MTAPRRILARQRDAGNDLSFTAFVMHAVARAVAEDPILHPYRRRHTLIMFDDVDVNTQIETTLSGQQVVASLLVRAANRKSVQELTSGIRHAQRDHDPTSERRLRKVLAFLGFAPAGRQEPTVRSLKAKIRALTHKTSQRHAAPRCCLPACSRVRQAAAGRAGRPPFPRRATSAGCVLRGMVDVVDTVEVGGFRIAFERMGHGPPLLLLHGFVGDGVGTWRYQLETLSDEFTVVAWDAPGAGHSSAAPESFRLPDYADCLFGFVSALKLTHPYVAGLSFGSMLALELFRRYRAVPRKLVLASAYAGWAGSFPPDVVQERLQLSLEVSGLPAADFVAALLPSMFSQGAAADRVADFAANVAEFHPVGFRAMAMASAEADLRGVLAFIDVPTLLLYGDQDVRAPREVAEALLKGIPGSRLVMMPGVGHASSVEAPDRFCAEVRAFLNER